jgi:hypothetical protein
MQLNWKQIGKSLLWLGATMTLLAVAGSGTTIYPTFFAEYYSAAIGLSLIVAGLLAMV